MNILHIVEDFSIESGGLRTVIKDLNFQLNKNGIGSYILSSKKESEDDIHIVNSRLPWLYSKKWEKEMNVIKEKYKIDIFHIHGVWMYPQYKAAKYSLKNNIPFILSIHGMYEPWLWNKGYFKKKFYFNLLVKKLFKRANYLHAITPQENNNLISLFPSLKIVEIPNLIEPVISKVDKNIKKQVSERYLLYLGRLDEKKGIDILIKALSEINDENIILKIAGAINNYHDYLQNLAIEIGVNHRIQFLGMIKGENKIELIKQAWILVAPSYSEVIGMVNLEAAILKTPVITTFQTGLNVLWNKNGGVLINPEKKELVGALNHVLSWSKKERLLNGEKLYNFVLKNYSWSNRFEDWRSTYESM